MMTKTLTFLHTSPVHIATFDRLCSELAPGVPVRHIVDESLLRDAREAGRITPELAKRVTQTVLDAVEAETARLDRSPQRLREWSRGQELRKAAVAR